jgi:hypothetical protein
MVHLDSPAPHVSSWLSWLYKSVVIPILRLPISAPGSADFINLWWSQYSSSQRHILSLSWLRDPDYPAPIISSCIRPLFCGDIDYQAPNIISCLRLSRLHEPWWIPTLQFPALDSVSADSVNLCQIPTLQLSTSSVSMCAAGFALLNLPKGKSLGRSKPETNSSNEQAH